MVTLFGFFDSCKVSVKLVLLHEAGAVDTLEHLAVGVASPVCAGAGGELDGIALDTAGRVQMRACTQIGEVALLIKAYDGILGQVVYKLDLIRLVLFLHELYGFLTGQLKALKLYLFLADLAHLGLDLLEYLGSDGKRCVKVIVKAVFDGRADS